MNENAESPRKAEPQDDDEADLRRGLTSKIAQRGAQDRRWARLDFMLAQLFLWLAIVASFLSAVLVADGEIPKFWLALLAAVPGTVLVIDKNFAFSRRARWHWEMEVQLDRLLCQLQYQRRPAAAVAADYGDLRVKMEDRFPGVSFEDTNAPKNAEPQ